MACGLDYALHGLCGWWLWHHRSLPVQMEIAEVLCAVVTRQDGLLAEMGDLQEQVSQLLRKQERAAWL